MAKVVMAGRVAVLAGDVATGTVLANEAEVIVTGDVGTIFVTGGMDVVGSCNVSKVWFVDIGKSIVGWVGTALVELGGMVEAALSFVAPLVVAIWSVLVTFRWVLSSAKAKVVSA